MTDGSELPKVFWEADELRAPLSLETYAARELLRRDLPNVGPGTIPLHLLDEFERIRNIHGVYYDFSVIGLNVYIPGSYIVRGAEIEAKYVHPQQGGTRQMDRFAWDHGNWWECPEIGETITVAGSVPGENNLRSLWFSSPSARIDIDWDDLHFPATEADLDYQPDKFKSSYFKDGRICSDEWWCWKLDGHDFDQLGPFGPFPQGTIEEWSLGRRQSLTINRVGELIWRCSTLQALDSDKTYPPAIETTWICKAKRC